MHSELRSSRALAALAALALCAPVLARGQVAGPAPAPRATDASFAEALRGQVRGALLASARVALADREVAYLVASQDRAKGRVTFLLLVAGADDAGGVALRARDELRAAELPGAPTVSLAANAPAATPGALTATVGWKAADGSAEERGFLYRYGDGRLTRLLEVAPSASPATGSGRPATRSELELLPTSTVGFRDLRVRVRECAEGGGCGEPIEVSSYTFDGSKYAERPYAIPFVEKIVASSELESKGGLEDRSASAAIDGRADTAWCEGAKGPGWFEKLDLTFSPAQRLKALTLLPGAGPGEAFRERARPKRIRVVLPDKTKFEADLADEARPQRIALPAWDRLFGMTIVIVDVYKGKQDDACIAELDLEVEP